MAERDELGDITDQGLGSARTAELGA